MKKIIIILFILKTVGAFSGNRDSTILKKVSEFNAELTFFTDSMNSYYKRNSDYLVFVVKFNEIGDNLDNYNITMGYLLNSFEYSAIVVNYFIRYNNQFVLIKIDETKNKDFIAAAHFEKITEQVASKVVSKLYPGKDGGFTYRGKGLTINYDGTSYEKTFYSNSDQIPYDKSIFTPLPDGVKVKRIE